MLKGLKTKKLQAILIGIIIILLSLIAIVDLKGYIGSILAYCFVFLFGDYYILPLIVIILSGILLIKNKKFKFSLPLFSLFFVILTICIYNSNNEWNVNDINTFYINMFNKTLPPFFKDFEFGILNGGYLGNALYTLLHNSLPSSIYYGILLLVFVSAFMISLKPIINLFVNMFYDLDEKQEVKKKKNEVKFINYEEVKKQEKVNDINIFNPNVSVNDFVNHEVKNNTERKSTLFMDLDFRQDSINNEVKTVSKPKDFNIFDDDLSFDNKPLVKEEVFNEVKVDEPIIKREEFVEEIKEDPIVEVNDEINITVDSSNDNFVMKNDDFFSNNSVMPLKTKQEEIYQEIKVEEPKKEVKQEEIKYKTPYVLPSMNLLNDVINSDDTENKNEAEIKGVRLNQKLASLNINAHVVNYIVAPSFTRFEIEVASDVKLSAFNNIKQDVMMALSAEKINILAPIPGTSYVGIEIPNVKRSTVSFKEVLKDVPFKDKNQKLLAVLGKDITGKTVTMKINDTPHLLIAGATGSGKSVCINTIIASLLMRTSYEDVKLILVDPKRVEMAIYSEIPHLMCPVINDPIKATVALNKICDIMDERYKLFSEEGSVVRSIESYNRVVTERGEKPLPYIVMIIDELSDLMLVAGKEVESAILRITQLARACGIHLIVATQRPSVDVITGIIKANLPSRIAFAVSTSADSRTILDQGGAEDLLGRGDSLVSMRGDLSMSRVQGAYVSDEEIERIVSCVIKQRRPVFDPRFLNLEPKQEVQDYGIEGLSCDDEDDLYEMVLNYVKTLKTVSTTSLQVRFKMGYPKARRMIDMLEENGAIGEANGSKGRQVLIHND